MDELEEQVDKGKDVNKALNRVIPKHQAKFVGLFQQVEEEDTEEDGDN